MFEYKRLPNQDIKLIPTHFDMVLKTNIKEGIDRINETDEYMIKLEHHFSVGKKYPKLHYMLNSEYSLEYGPIIFSAIVLFIALLKVISNNLDFL